MVSNKSLDEVNLIAALLRDFHKSHGVVFNNRALKLTTQVVFKRVRLEGLGFLTKTLPRLGKAFDQALSGGPSLNANALGFAAMRGSELPMFMGEFFKLVLHQDGTVLPCPCADSVRVLRQLLYLFYKYELPYSDKQERKVLDCFKKAEQDLHEHASILSDLSDRTDAFLRTHSRCSSSDEMVNVVRRAKHLLWKAFERFDPSDIVPRHGPGAVATKQQLWGKYQWSNVTRRITDVYPLDEYFFVNLEHVCDRQQELQALTDNENSARVILVPKDSRGPRLISCEPVDFQWVQQGLGEAIVRHIEGNKLTKFNVFFTDQGPNQRGALLGSSTGRYATLDLKEASDRVSLDLVRLLFPKHVYTYLEACRSLSTRMPDGEVIQLAKFAPMGSALCFPILALTIWSILSAGTRNTDTRESILVYGDDVIVPTAYAGKAIELLESFGLLVNRDKSCTKGLFRESCGVDAFKGRNVTPVRLRTVWSSSPCPESYCSWISYANSFYDRGYRTVYDYIVEKLSLVYGEVPGEDMCLTCPSLREVTDQLRPKRSRTNVALQKREWLVWDLRTPKLRKRIDGWSMLLRYFTEGSRALPAYVIRHRQDGYSPKEEHPFSVGLYTRRRASMLVRRWR